MTAIEIVAYRSSWPAEFVSAGAALRDGLGARALAIHHIGSTSVPGLCAKDVIDVQVSVGDLPMDVELQRGFERVGFPCRDGPARDHLPLGAPDRPGDWTKAIASQRAGQRRVNVHIRAAGRPNQRYPLLFRDYLRATPAAAASYGLIKVELVALHADDEDAYYAVKDPVCDLIVTAAQSWAERGGWELPPTDA